LINITGVIRIPRYKKSLVAKKFVQKSAMMIWSAMMTIKIASHVHTIKKIVEKSETSVLMPWILLVAHRVDTSGTINQRMGPSMSVGI
jgi:predicted CDP-diglyceride synthetase/phosphatidate cytidylyltransferase